jgi:hypothetical protein
MNSIMRKQDINQYHDKRMVLWQNGFMHRGEIPAIVVQFHGAPQYLKFKKIKHADSCNEIVKPFNHAKIFII